MSRSETSVSRRQFLAQSAAGAAVTFAAPAILSASKTDSQIIIGEGDYKYQVEHAWPQLPKNTPGRPLITSPSITLKTSMSSTKGEPTRKITPPFLSSIKRASSSARSGTNSRVVDTASKSAKRTAKSFSTSVRINK